jgi:septation ring formation regulator EzrA
MPTEIITALISGFTTLLVSIGTWHFSAKKDREKQRDDIKAELIKYHEKNREEIQEIRQKDLRELRDDLTNMGANLQQKIAVIETNINILSDRVEKHNSVIERTYRLEETDKLLDEKIKVANARILDLEHKAG